MNQCFKKGRHNKSTIPFIIFFMVLTLCMSSCKGNNNNPKKNSSISPIAVETKTIKKEEIIIERTLTGDVVPMEIVPLSFKVSGQIRQINVDEGDKVKKGELVAILDARDYRLMSDLAKAQENALSPHLERAKELLKQEALPASTLDELTGKMEIAKIQKYQAQSQLSYSRLVSPIDGVIVKKMASVGNLTSPENPVAVIAKLDIVKAVFPVTQKDLVHFNLDQEVEVKVSGIPKRFTGKVSNIGLMADEKTRTFPVTLEIANPDLQLRAGMIVEAKFEIARHKGIFVPLEALSSDDKGNPVALYVDEIQGIAQAAPLVISQVTGDRVMVNKGLKEGQQVIIRGLATPGDKVVIKKNNSSPGKTSQ